MALAALLHAHQMLLPMQDESVGLYAHVARAWLAGHAPYTTAWEYKPPGLFAIYGLALALVPWPAIAVGVLGIACISITALALWKIGPVIDAVGGERTGRFAALFFVLLSVEDDGVVTDAEVSIDPFIALAFWLALRSPITVARAVAIGLLLGAALQGKLSAAPLLAPVVLLVALVARTPFRAVGATLAGIAAPFIFEIAGYAAIGQLPALLFANGGATLARARGLRGGLLAENADIFAKHLRIYAPAIEFALAALGHRFTIRTALVTFGWLAAALISIVAIGEFYSRQFLLVCAPIALLAGLGLRRILTWFDARGFETRVAVAVIFLATFGLHGYFETMQAARVALGLAGVERLRVPDRYDAIVRGIACVRAPGDRVFLISLSPYVYDLLATEAPTRFPFTEHLLDDRMGVMIGVDPERELARIFATRPDVIVTGDAYHTNVRFARARVNEIDTRLARAYRVVARVPQATLYVRRDRLATHLGAGRCAAVASAL